jgi:hypothetical protein
MDASRPVVAAPLRDGWWNLDEKGREAEIFERKMPRRIDVDVDQFWAVICWRMSRLRLLVGSLFYLGPYLRLIFVNGVMKHEDDYRPSMQCLQHFQANLFIE